MSEAYYTVEQISHMLDLHPKTVQRYIREGKLRAVKIGKSWRIAGHDLSVFTESEGAAVKTDEKNIPPAARRVLASSVVDIDVSDKDEAIRILNTITAVLSTKPPEYGPTSMHSQFIEHEQKVRVTLWGGARFMAAMMDMLADLTEESERM